MNEAKMILKMFEEGKITMEEAEALLEALGMSAGATSTVFNMDQEEHAKSRERQVHPQTEDEFNEFVEAIEDQFEELDDQLGELDDVADDELDELTDHLDDLDDMENISDEKKEEIRSRAEAVRQKIEERRQKIKENRQEIRKKRKEYNKYYRTHNGIGDEIRSGIDELAQGVQDFRKKFEAEGMTEVRSTLREISDEINKGMNELHKGLKQGVKDVKKAFQGNNFWDMLNGIVGSVSFGWPGIAIEDEISGMFDSSCERVEIEVKTSNGRIEVEGTDDPGYTLHLLYQVHADNEEEARKVKDDMVTITQEPGVLRVRSKEGRLGSVAVKLYIPKKLEANIKLLTSNGRIVIQNLQNKSLLELGSSNGRLDLANLRVKELHGRTSNGRIEIKNAASEVLDVVTSNGAIYIEGICEQVHAQTSNGTISVYPHIMSKGTLDLGTSNGRIKVVVADRNLGLDIDATSTMGSINLDIPGLEYQRKIEKHSRHEYKAHTHDLQTREKQLQIQASTSLGSIYMGYMNE